MDHLSNDVAPRHDRRPPLSRRARRRREAHGRELMAFIACALLFLAVLVADLIAKPNPAAPIHGRAGSERPAP